MLRQASGELARPLPGARSSGAALLVCMCCGQALCTQKQEAAALNEATEMSAMPETMSASQTTASPPIKQHLAARSLAEEHRTGSTNLCRVRLSDHRASQAHHRRCQPSRGQLEMCHHCCAAFQSQAQCLRQQCTSSMGSRKAAEERDPQLWLCCRHTAAQATSSTFIVIVTPLTACFLRAGHVLIA